MIYSWYELVSRLKVDTKGAWFGQNGRVPSLEGNLRGPWAKKALPVHIYQSYGPIFRV